MHKHIHVHYHRSATADLVSANKLNPCDVWTVRELASMHASMRGASMVEKDMAQLMFSDKSGVNKDKVDKVEFGKHIDTCRDMYFEIAQVSIYIHVCIF